MSTSSPPIDVGSSESSMSEDAVAEIVAKSASAKASSVPSSRRESSRSPAPDQAARTGSSLRRKSNPSRQGSAAAGEEPADGSHSSSGRKKRARSTPDDFESNGRKSATDLQRDTNLWPGGDVDGPFQSSLLEEVLAEKKMALLRSPEVMRFLQQRQALLQASQNTVVVPDTDHAVFSSKDGDDSQESS